MVLANAHQGWDLARATKHLYAEERKEKCQCTRSLAKGRLSDLEGCLLNRTWSSLVGTLTQVAKIANIPNARLGVGNAACWEWQPRANQNLDICASGWDPWLFGSRKVPKHSPFSRRIVCTGKSRLLEARSSIKLILVPHTSLVR